MSTHANMVKMTVSSVGADPYTITLNAASSGFQSFADAYGANATVDILITQGTVWEVARNCTYTHSGTTVTRGTFEDSSTGSRITTFDNTATVSVVATADSGRRWDSAALTWVAASVTTANVTGVVGQMSALDVSGLTAARNFVLPAVAAVNDRVGVYITAGCATAGRELIIIGDTGATINGGSAATEWSRLFIVNECVILRCVTANTAWVVENDGRIPCNGHMNKTTETTVASGGNGTKIIMDAIADQVGSGFCNTSSGRFDIRRGGKYLAIARVGASGTSITGHQTRLGNASGYDALGAFAFDLVASGSCPNPPFSFAAATGSYADMACQHSSGDDRNYWYGVNAMSLRLIELLS